MHLPTVLEQIVVHKRQEVAQRKQQQPQESLQALINQQTAPRGFLTAIQAKVAQQQPAVIAEIKRASPSQGVIRESFNPTAIATDYQAHGACCLSVLTDEPFFQGSTDALKQARAAVNLPVIRKDFMIDRYQILESRAMGADCVLLIVALFMDNAPLLAALYDMAIELGMDVLIEVHNQDELALALTLSPCLLGINNRNLHTFDVTLENTFALLDHVPDSAVLVTESGIHTRDDVTAMRAKGVHVFLVGETFMRAPEPGKALEALFF